MLTRGRLLAVVLAACLMAAACASGPSGDVATAGSPARASAAAVATPPASAAADSAAALVVFRENIAAIHRRDRARYLSVYLQSPRLARAGPAGLQLGYADFAAGAGESWPDTLVATHMRVVPVTDGVVYGAYHYRVTPAGGEAQRGVSERVLIRTPVGWRVAVTTAFASPPGTPPPPYALVGATLVDGTGAAPVPNAAVVLRNGRIECAGPRAACPVPPDAEVVDAAGKWITPGLIDAHVHYSQTGWADGRPDALNARDRFPYERVVADLAANPQRFHQAYLCAGVTAVFDVGGYPWTLRMRADTDTASRAPTVAATGPLLSTVDFWLNVPGERQFIHMADEAATRAGARFLAANGADAVKVWYIVRQDADTTHLKSVLRAAADEATRANLPLVVHATTLWAAKDALRAGARVLVHGVTDRAVDEEFLRLARAADVVYTPTLVVRDGYDQLRGRAFDADRYPLECIDPGTRAKAFLTDSLPGGLDADRRAAAAASAARRFELEAENVRRIHAAGIPVAAGTDAGNPLTLHGSAIYLELEALQRSGLSPMETLIAGTRNGALAMGRVDELGTIEPGKVADLLVLGADPTADIANMRELALVVRRGEVWTRGELTFRGAAARAASH